MRARKRHVAVLLLCVLSTLAGWIGASAGGTPSEPVIAAAGDIACASTDVPSSPNGNVCQTAATSDLLLGRHFAKVLALGDEQYPCGSLADFRTSTGRPGDA